MNREEIKRMAAISEVSMYGVNAKYLGLDASEGFFNRLERFATLVAKQEREACANVCEKFAGDMTVLAEWGASQCANAIRARGQA